MHAVLLIRERAKIERGEYCILKLLHRGFFTEVFLASHIHRGRVVLKVTQFNRHEQSREIFNNEVRYISRLGGILESSNYIVRVFEAYVVEEMYGVISMEAMEMDVMDFIEKHKLDDDYREIVHYIMHQVASSIQFLHSLNIIHGDIKPENILLRFPSSHNKDTKNNDVTYELADNKTGSKNKLPIVCLCDFGSAFEVSGNIDPRTQIRGTKEYWAPEYGRKPIINTWSKLDIWSLGVTFFVVLSQGLYPFATTPVGNMEIHSIANYFSIKSPTPKQYVNNDNNNKTNVNNNNTVDEEEVTNNEKKHQACNTNIMITGDLKNINDDSINWNEFFAYVFKIEPNLRPPIEWICEFMQNNYNNNNRK